MQGVPKHYPSVIGPKSSYVVPSGARLSKLVVQLVKTGPKISRVFVLEKGYFLGHPLSIETQM